MRALKILFAVVVGVLLMVASPGAASAAAPRATYAFDMQVTYGEGRTGYEGSHATGGTLAGGRQVDVDVPGAPRRPWKVARVLPGEELSVGTTGEASTSAWTAVLTLRPDAVDGQRRLLTPANFSDLGLYVVDGRLAWRTDNGTIATGTTPVEADHWITVAITRDADGLVRAFLGGTQELEVSDPVSESGFMSSLAVLRARAHDSTAGSGDVARLRIWRSALTPAEIADLDVFDTSPPTLTIDEQHPQWAPLFPNFAGTSSDDGTVRPTIRGTVTDDAGTVVDAFQAFVWDTGNWAANGTHALVDAQHYTVTIVATDMAGNSTTYTRPFFADGRAPALDLGGVPDATTDATPAVGGGAGTSPGDADVVALTVRRTATGQQVDTGQVRVAGGRFGLRLPKLRPGEYTVSAAQTDWASRRTEVSRRLRILAPAGAPATLAPAGGKHPVELGARSAARLRAAALRAMRRAGARNLAAGRGRVTFAADRAGTARIEIRRGKQLLLRGRRVAARAGRVTVKLTATSAGRRALRGARRIRLRVLATFAPRTGGGSATSAGRLTLTRR